MLLYLPIKRGSLQNRYFGPYVVHKRVNDTRSAEIKLTNSQVLADLRSHLQHLDSPQRAELTTLIQDNVSICQHVPTVTNTLIQDVCFEQNATPFRQHAYRLKPAKRSVLKTEIDYMLKPNILEPSNSQWASSVILTEKGDSSFRVCTDPRMLINSSMPSFYPVLTIAPTMLGASPNWTY